MEDWPSIFRLLSGLAMRYVVYLLIRPILAQVIESDIASHRMLSDPTDRQNPIGFLFSESLSDPIFSFYWASDDIRSSEPTKF